jgi:hypothetical protein
MGLFVQTCLSEESFYIGFLQEKWCATANSIHKQNIHLENGTVPASIKIWIAISSRLTSVQRNR